MVHPHSINGVGQRLSHTPRRLKADRNRGVTESKWNPTPPRGVINGRLFRRLDARRLSTRPAVILVQAPALTARLPRVKPRPRVSRARLPALTPRLSPVKVQLGEVSGRVQPIRVRLAQARARPPGPIARIQGSNARLPQARARLPPVKVQLREVSGRGVTCFSGVGPGIAGAARRSSEAQPGLKRAAHRLPYLRGGFGRDSLLYKGSNRTEKICTTTCTPHPTFPGVPAAALRGS